MPFDDSPLHLASIIFQTSFLSFVFLVHYQVNLLRLCGFRVLPEHRDHPSVFLTFPFDLRNYRNIFLLFISLKREALMLEFSLTSGSVFWGLPNFGFPYPSNPFLFLLAQFSFGFASFGFSRFIGVSLCVYNIT